MVKFNPGIGLEAEPDRIRIQISLLGENGMEKWNKILGHFNPDEDFPVVPYPSLDPFRTDSIIKEYKELFKQEDAKDNIIYAHERNPFELYRLLTRFIQSEDEILGKVKQMACYGIALLSRIPIIEKLRYNKKRDYSLFICEVRQKMSIFANEIIKTRNGEHCKLDI